MLQANTKHADFVHARIVLSLSFQGDQRQARQAKNAEGTNRSGRKGTYAGGTSGSGARHTGLAAARRASRNNTTLR